MTSDRDAALQALTAHLDPTKRDSYEADGEKKIMPVINARVICADGFSMSVQASNGHYCSPRDNTGPWQMVEVGYPSERVESFMPYVDGNPEGAEWETVYGYVPVEIVVDAIVQHGGVAPVATPSPDTDARLAQLEAENKAMREALALTSVYGFEDADNLILKIAGVEVLDTTDEDEKVALLKFSVAKDAALSTTASKGGE